MDWCSCNGAYSPWFGHYKLVKNKKIKRTKNSLNCWIKKVGFVNYQLNIIFKKNGDNYSLTYFYYGEKDTGGGASFLNLFEATIFWDQYPIPPKQIPQTKRINRTLASLDGNERKYIHFLEIFKKNKGC
jgi:hypothetical protein